MEEILGDLFNSTEKDPSYWAQVALLEFLQSLDAVRISKDVLSNKKFAELLGVSPPTLSRWLNGNENLTVKTMCRLAAALGAAVHIHVADNTTRGRWREEPGEWKAEQGETEPGSPATPSESVLLPFESGRRPTSRKVSQEADMSLDEPMLEAAAYG